MEEILTISGGIKKELFSIPPIENAGSTTVVDTAKGISFNSAGTSAVVENDATYGKCINFPSQGRMEQLTPFDLAITLNKDFEISFDIFLASYPTQEGSIFSQWSAVSGTGFFCFTMFNGNGSTKMSFFWVGRNYVVSNVDVPLNRFVNVKVKRVNSYLTMYFDDIPCTTPVLAQFSSVSAPMGIGGYYGTSAYSMVGKLKNIKIKTP